MEKANSKRGYIGPLGDDIPSIFPIVAAVLIFIGTILYANGLVSQKAKNLEIREGSLSLSYLVTDTGFISDRAILDKTCDEKIKPRAASLGVKFLITLKRFCDGIPSDFASSDERFNPYPAGASVKTASPFFVQYSNEDGKTWTLCTNAPEVYAFLKDKGEGLFPQPADSVLASFPVAVPCPASDSFTSGLGVINVITWKGNGK